jgi:diguanylate cyclase (GGDEF)-like protein
MTDALTKLNNRRFFDLCLARELGRAMDSGMPIAVLALDLDDLKGHNDRGGHHAGDRALATVGEVLRATCRSRDLPSRFGGDEFAVVMPRSTAREAAVLGERIRAELHARAPNVTVSIGAADIDQIGRRDPEGLLAAADRALFLAKAEGKDKLVVLGDEPGPRARWPMRCVGPEERVVRCPTPIAAPLRCAASADPLACEII